MFLHPHNQETYTNLTTLFHTHNRVAVVQPTGTGKSFLMLQLIYDNSNKQFLITAPSAYIFTQIRTHATDNAVSIENCKFLTFSKLAVMSAEEISDIMPEYIIIDEFHRCGAVEWSKGIENLLQAYPDAKVLGTSATPIRYLDSCRNMAEELFHGVYAVNLSLAEAIRRKILPLPIYVTSWYSFRGDIALLEKKAETSKNLFYRHVLYGKIRKAKTLVADQNCGLETIFAKHMRNRNGKYIVFCANEERLHQAQAEARSWFTKVNAKIHSYAVYASYGNSQQEFAQFRDDTSFDALKLLFSIDMLNEGVHVEDIEGVIMLRATQSANVFYQQLGRALSCSVGKQPVIFDIVNNFETGDTAKQYREIMQIGRENRESDSEFDIQFELYDYVRDIRDLLNDIRNTFEDSWEVVYEALRTYLERHQHFPEYFEEFCGYKLGVWCSNQRQIRNAGHLSEERIQKLDELGFVWDTRDERWNSSFQLAKRYQETHSRLPVRSDTSETAGTIYQWIANQKQLFRNGKLSEERKLLLESVGVSFMAKTLDAQWEENYNVLCRFQQKNGRLPTTTDAKEDVAVYSVYRWISKQRKAFKDGQLSVERIEKLNAIGFVWDKADALWNERFETLKLFVRENGRTPNAKDKYQSECIGQWLRKQMRYYREGTLDQEKVQQLAMVIRRFDSDNR